jgi:ligand-binding sensor domain-containing protein
MIKYFLIILLLSIDIAVAQHIPSTFNLKGERKLNKTLSENPSGNSVSDIITIGDTIWIGSSKGVSLSTDNGTTWQNFYGNTAFGTESISAISYDQGVFWAATAHTVDENGQSLPEGSGLRYTTNNGLTWNSISQPVDNSGDSIVPYGINNLRALPVTVKVQNLIYDIAFTPGTIWIDSLAGGLRKSTDMGTTWQRVVIPPDNLNSIKPTDTLDFCLQPVAGKFCSDNNLNYRVFSVISVNDSTLYVGTAGGINKSTDGGISWTKFTHLNEDNPITGNFVVALAYNLVNTKVYVWAATWQAEGSTESYGVSFTNNGGNSWNTSLDKEHVHNFGFKSGDVIAASDDGAFRSSDLGISWILPNSIYDNQTKITLTTSIYYAAASIVIPPSGMSSGINEVWLGSNDGLAKMSEIPGEMWQGKWKIFRSSPSLSLQTQTYAYPNPFSPKQDILKIKYSTGGKSSSVTIRIFDFGMNYVRTVINNAIRGQNSHVVDNFNLQNNGVEDTWDGRDAAGNIVPNGVYFYRIEFDSNNPVFGKILVLQ